MSIQSKIFPTAWKTAKVVPLHKKEEKTSPQNYRPVALLPLFSKILEKAVFIQTIEYLESNELLHPSHHGFRKYHNTCTALIEMHDAWMEALENEEISAVILVDMSCAFDCVDSEILIEKLRLYGGDPSSVQWFQSYLTNRSQKVFIEGSLSSSLSLEAGVPQGSILGPLLYVLFTNDLPEIVHLLENCAQHQHLQVPPKSQVPLQAQAPLQAQYNLHCQHCGGLCCYADDSTFSKSNKDPVILKEEIDLAYNKIADYMNKNKLILNSEKTHLIVMASSKNHKKYNNYNITLNTGNEIIEPSPYEKLLGGYISCDLTWNLNIRDHEQSLLKIITSRINALSKISKIANFKTRKMIANGIVLSKLIYLIQLWGSCNQYLLNTLQKLQNRAARLVTRKNIYTPVRDLLKQCGWLSVKQLVVYHDLLLVYKTMSTKRPSHLFNKFSQSCGIRTRVTGTAGIMENGKINSEFGKKKFSYRAVKQWNELPPSVRLSPTLSTFKLSIRKWITEKIPI